VVLIIPLKVVVGVVGVPDGTELGSRMLALARYCFRASSPCEKRGLGISDS
jgi:hypothetical protein